MEETDDLKIHVKIEIDGAILYSRDSDPTQTCDVKTREASLKTRVRHVMSPGHLAVLHIDTRFGLLFINKHHWFYAILENNDAVCMWNDLVMHNKD